MRLDFRKLVKAEEEEPGQTPPEPSPRLVPAGFNQLYDAHLKTLRSEYFWDLDALIFLAFGAIAFIPIVIWLFTQRPSFVYLLLVLIFLGVAAVVTCYLALIVQLTLGSTYNNPSKRAVILAAKLLAAEKRPYTHKRGLVNADFQRLKKIVEIEQQAENWQGNFTQLVMIGTLVVAIWLPASWWHALSIAPGQPGGTFLYALIHSIPPFFQGVVLLIFGTGITILLYRWYLYFREFVSITLSNRILLRACEEALALTENLRLNSSSEFSIREKKALVEYMGCQLIAWERATQFERRSGTPFEEAAGEKWLLVYPAYPPGATKLSQWWRKIQSTRIPSWKRVKKNHTPQEEDIS